MAESKVKMINILVLSIVCLFEGTDGAHILGIFPMTAKSHFNYNHAILKSLYDAGHQVTMINPFSPKEKVDNFTYVDSRLDSKIHVGNIAIKYATDLSYSSVNELILNNDIQYCHNVMKLKEIQEALNSREKLYDVIFVEILMGHYCYLPIAEKLGIPVIGTVTSHTYTSADEYIGLPHSTAVIPTSISSTELEMTSFERIGNLWIYLVFYYYYKILLPERLKEFYREHFGTEEISKKEISLIFYNNHPSFLSRCVTPNAIEVGGIHMTPPSPLPENLQRFIDEATHGVVLFTFGSVVRTSSLTSEQREAFLAALSTIPQRVIWKYEEPIGNLPKNIMLSSWLPQRDILEHKKVIAFMSHCGQSGTYEAMVTGTPVIAIPLFTDQYANAVNLKRRGVAVSLDFKTVTKEKVLDALNTIINDTGYYQRMQALSRAFKDRPMSPQKSVVYWTEYVIRHDGARHLKALGTDMPFYKYFMLDIAALLFMIASLVTYVIYKTVKYFCISIRSPSTYSMSGKKIN